METRSDIVKEGYVKSQGPFLGIWKRSYLLLRVKSHRGEARIEKYLDEEASHSMDIQSTVVELRYVQSVSRIPESEKKYGVAVQDNAKLFRFAADSETQANQWLEAIKSAIGSRRSEENSFPVYLMQTTHLMVHGDVILLVTSDSVQVLHRDSQRGIVSWKLNTIRRYGVEHRMFQLESGRNSSTGPGVFLFDSKDAEAVYQCVHAAVQSQRQQGAGAQSEIREFTQWIGPHQQAARDCQATPSRRHTPDRSTRDDTRPSHQTPDRSTREDNVRNDARAETGSRRGEERGELAPSDFWQPQNNSRRSNFRQPESDSRRSESDSRRPESDTRRPERRDELVCQVNDLRLERNRENDITSRHCDLLNKLRTKVKVKASDCVTVANSVFYVDSKSSKNSNIAQGILGEARAERGKKDTVKELYNGGVPPQTYSDEELSKEQEQDDDNCEGGSGPYEYVSSAGLREHYPRNNISKKKKVPTATLR